MSGTRTDAKIARLARLIDVLFTGLANNDLIFYNSATQKWENKAGFATETNTGIGRIATQAEMNAGLLDDVFTTPLKVATYVNTAIAGGVQFMGGYNATTNTPDLVTPAPGVVFQGDMYVVTVAGTFFGEALEIGDSLIATIDDPAALSDWIRVEKNVSLQDLASVLAEGNTTGANDIIVAIGQALQIGAATENIFEASNYMEFEALKGFEFNVTEALKMVYAYIGLDTKNDAVLWIQDLVNNNYSTLNGSELQLEFYKNGEFNLIVSRAAVQTGDRVQTFQDASGTIALTSDIAANTVYFTTIAAALAYTDFRSNSLVIINDPALVPYSMSYVISTVDGTFGTSVFKTITNTQIKYFTTGAAFLAYTDFIPGSLVVLNDPANPYYVAYVISSTDGTYANTVFLTVTDEDVLTKSHTQNTDTGTISASFIINSAGFKSTLGTSLLTANRAHELPNAGGTIALLSDIVAGNTVVTKAVADSPYTAVNKEIILCNAVGGNMTINLPAAALNAEITVKKTDASVNTVTVDGNAAQTIDGALTQVITAQWVSITMVSDGSNWFIV